MTRPLRGFAEANKVSIHLMLGTLIAQIFSTSSIFIIAHRLNPFIFGEYSFIIAVLNIAIPFSLFKSEVLLVNKEVTLIWKILTYAFRRLMTASLIIIIIFTFIVLEKWEYTPQRAIITLFLIYIANLTLNFVALVIAFALRVKNFTSIVYSGIVQNFLTLVCQIFFLEIEKSLDSLLLAFIIGRMFSILVIISYKDIRKLWHHISRVERKNSDRNDIEKASKDLTFSALADQLTANSPLILVFILNDKNLLGIIALSLSLVMAQATLITSGFAMPILAKNKIGGDVDQNRLQLRRNFSLLSILVVVFCLSNLFLSDFVIGLLFESDWNQTPFYIKSFLIPTAISILVSPYLQLLISRGNTIITFKSSILSLAVVIIAGSFLLYSTSASFAAGTILYARVSGQLVIVIRHIWSEKKKSSKVY